MVRLVQPKRERYFQKHSDDQELQGPSGFTSHPFLRSRGTTPDLPPSSAPASKHLRTQALPSGRPRIPFRVITGQVTKHQSQKIIIPMRAFNTWQATPKPVLPQPTPLDLTSCLSSEPSSPQSPYRRSSNAVIPKYTNITKIPEERKENKTANTPPRARPAVGNTLTSAFTPFFLKDESASKIPRKPRSAYKMPTSASNVSPETNPTPDHIMPPAKAPTPLTAAPTPALVVRGPSFVAPSSNCALPFPAKLGTPNSPDGAPPSPAEIKQLQMLGWHHAVAKQQNAMLAAMASAADLKQLLGAVLQDIAHSSESYVPGPGGSMSGYFMNVATNFIKCADECAMLSRQLKLSGA